MDRVADKSLPPMLQNKFMAQALGGYKGFKYSNCEEALLNSIKCGFQFCEVDLAVTDDDYLVCSHGWSQKDCMDTGMEYRDDFSDMTHEKFLAQKIHGMKTMDGEMLYRYMQQYPQLYLEMDLKTLPYDESKHMAEKIVETFQNDQEVLGRCLVQVDTEEMYEAIESVYHFAYYQFNIIKDKYDQLDEIISYCAEHKICAVALKKKFATKENLNKARQAGLAVLVYTIDDLATAKELLACGANTVGTNFIHLYINQQLSSKEELHELYDKYHRYPLQMNKIVCSNFHGKGFGCNPKYIVKELLKRGENLDIVWLGGAQSDVPEGVRTVPFQSEEAIMEMATARVLIENQMKFVGFKKRPDQFFIETWHGAIPLKKIGLDNPANSNKYDGRRALNFNSIDLAISNSRFCTEMYRRSFKYRDQILEEGYPRNDLFFEPQEIYKKKVCEMLHIPAGSKLIMYAPTFRKERSLDAYQLDYQKVCKSLGEEWKMLVRLHPHMQKQAKNIEYSDRVINASTVPDMQELMAATDILVTDYSNIMFEFMITERPCFIYATDIEKYRKERDYYFEIYDLPFPVSETTEELIEKIKSFDQGQYQTKIKEFAKEVGLHETGEASKKVADIIIAMTSKRRYRLRRSMETRARAVKRYFTDRLTKRVK